MSIDFSLKLNINIVDPIEDSAICRRLIGTSCT